MHSLALENLYQVRDEDPDLALPALVQQKHRFLQERERSVVSHLSYGEFLSRLAQQSPTLFRSAQPGGNTSFKPDDTDKLGFVASLGREIPYLLYRLCGFRVPAKLAKDNGEVEAEHIEQALVSLMLDERFRLEESIQGTLIFPHYFQGEPLFDQVTLWTASYAQRFVQERQRLFESTLAPAQRRFQIE